MTESCNQHNTIPLMEGGSRVRGTDRRNLTVNSYTYKMISALTTKYNLPQKYAIQKAIEKICEQEGLK